MNRVILIIKIPVPKFMCNFLCKKRGLVKCSNCNQMTNPGNYCEQCGASL